MMKRVLPLLFLATRSAFPQDWTELQKSALAALQRKDLSKAEADLNRALPIAEKTAGKDDHLGKTLAALGDLERARKRNAEAERYYKRAVAAFEPLGQIRAVEMSGALQSIGEIYIEQKQYKLAEPVIYRATKIRSNKLAADPETFRSLQSMARVYSALGKTHEAHEAWEAIFIFRSAANMPDDLASAQLHDEYATFLIDNGMAEQGKLYREQAASIRAKARR